jgi:hypothetical protein
VTIQEVIMDSAGFKIISNGKTVLNSNGNGILSALGLKVGTQEIQDSYTTSFYLNALAGYVLELTAFKKQQTTSAGYTQYSGMQFEGPTVYEMDLFPNIGFNSVCLGTDFNTTDNNGFDSGRKLAYATPGIPTVNTYLRGFKQVYSTWGDFHHIKAGGVSTVTPPIHYVNNLFYIGNGRWTGAQMVCNADNLNNVSAGQTWTTILDTAESTARAVFRTMWAYILTKCNTYGEAVFGRYPHEWMTYNGTPLIELGKGSYLELLDYPVAFKIIFSNYSSELSDVNTVRGEVTFYGADYGSNNRKITFSWNDTAGLSDESVQIFMI